MGRIAVLSASADPESSRSLKLLLRFIRPHCGPDLRVHRPHNQELELRSLNEFSGSAWTEQEILPGKRFCLGNPALDVLRCPIATASCPILVPT